MTVGLGAAGFVGIAPEATAGTYVAPTKYLVLRNESLKHKQATIWRRPLRGIADVAGAIGGNLNIEGSIDVEVTSDTLPHILRAARATGAKTGASAPFTYTFTPNAAAIPTKTLSITVVRNGVVFGYTGCIISQQKYNIDNGTLVATFDIIGRNEASQSAPTPTYVTTVPYGAGQYTLKIPAAGAAITDADTFELAINDNGAAEFRLNGTSAAATFARFGERSVELSVNRDFESRTDYDAYKALTAQAVQLACTKDANDSITFDVFAAIKDTYDITGMSGQGELIRANIKYNGTYSDSDSASYKITCVTDEDIVTFP